LSQTNKQEMKNVNEISLESKARQEEKNQRQKLWAMKRWASWANIAVMTIPIKKRIINELFIDRKQGLYIQKGDKEMDRGKYLTFWKRVKLKQCEK